jgi:hypothetical protein
MQRKEEMLKEIDHRRRQPILQMIVYEQVKANNLTDSILCSTDTCGYIQSIPFNYLELSVIVTVVSGARVCVSTL